MVGECIKLYRQTLQLANTYTPPVPSVPTLCDICSKEFCSRACQKVAWQSHPSHRAICETVVENGEIATVVTQMEMKQSLSQDKMRVAMGA